MRAALVCIAVFATSAFAGCSKGGYKNCLKACRDCDKVMPENKGDAPTCPTASPFNVTSRVAGDCKQLTCTEPGAALVVDGHTLVDKLVCFQHQWHYFDSHYELVMVDAAACHNPTITCDEDAERKFNCETLEWYCECKPGYEDKSEAIGKPQGTVCTRCCSKKLNVIVLIDNSGSMHDHAHHVELLASAFVKLFHLGNDSSLFSIAHFGTTFKIRNTFNETAASDAAMLEHSILESTKGTQSRSRLWAGLEGVKAAVVQPYHVNSCNEHFIVTITDGAIEDDDARSKVSIASRNLENLDVGQFVVGFGDPHHHRNIADVVHGYDSNVVIVEDTNEDAVIAALNKLQRLVCA